MIVQHCHFVPGKNVDTVNEKDLADVEGREEWHYDVIEEGKCSNDWICNSPIMEAIKVGNLNTIYSYLLKGPISAMYMKKCKLTMLWYIQMRQICEIKRLTRFLFWGSIPYFS